MFHILRELLKHLYSNNCQFLTQETNECQKNVSPMSKTNITN